jgi:hypothetical protein
MIPFACFAVPKVEMLANKVTVTNKIKTEAMEDNLQITPGFKNFLNSLNRFHFVKSMELAHKAEIVSKFDTKGIETKSQTLSYFVRLNFPQVKDALVSFKVESKYCHGVDKCYPSLKITPIAPFKFYLSHEHFSLNRFDINQLKSSFKYECKKGECSTNSSFELSNLFLLDWLNKVRVLFGSKENPNSHEVLLMVKNNLVNLDKNFVNGL